MDILSTVLSTAAVTGSVAATVYAGEDWGIELAAVPGAAFHAITSGTAYLMVEGDGPVQLAAGDTVLLPGGAAHRLLSTPDAPARPFDHLRAEAALAEGGDLLIGNGTPSTQIICASYSHDPATRLSPFSALPPVVYVPALSSPAGLRSALALISEELHLAGPGLRSVLDHAVDIVLVQILRTWISGPGAETRPPSWLRGLADPTVGSALRNFHLEPALPWTVETLARSVGVSRATLARRFDSEVGQSAADYIRSWRMNLAARRLRQGGETVGVIARSVGYQSEYSFNRAFARHYGSPPGRYRSSTGAVPDHAD